MQCNATLAQHWRAMHSYKNHELVRRSGIPDLERRAVRRLRGHGSWHKVTNQLQKDTVRVNRMDDTPGIGISTRATRSDLREKRHVLRFKYRYSPLDIGHREGQAVDALVIDWRWIGGLRIKRRHPLQ